MKGMLCFASFHVTVHFFGGKTVIEIVRCGGGTTERFLSGYLPQDIDCSIFNSRIELKSTRLTSVWVTSIHCIDSRWVTPYWLWFPFFHQHAAIDEMQKKKTRKTTVDELWFEALLPNVNAEKHVWWESPGWVMPHLLKNIFWPLTLSEH